MAKKNLAKFGVRTRAIDALVEVGKGDNGLDRRAFLIGAATVIAGQAPIGRAAGAVLRPIAKVRRSRSGVVESVTVAGLAGGTWTVETRLFRGSPVLSVIDTSEGAVISLSGALLPGTDLRLDFNAKIVSRLMSRRIEFAFHGTGVAPVDFGFESDLDRWLRDEAEPAKLDAAQVDRLIGGKIAPRVSLNGRAGQVAFLPDNSLRVAAPIRAEVAGKTFDLTELALRPTTEDADRLVDGQAKSYTVLIAKTNPGSAQETKVATRSGWTVTGTREGVADLRAELHPGGACGLLVTGGRCAFAAAAAGGPSLGLLDPKSLHIARDEGCTDGVVARLNPCGNRLQMQNCSVDLGPADGDNRFVALEGVDASHDDVRLAIHRYALGIEDAVVAAHSVAPVPVEIALGQIRRRQPPTRSGGQIQIKPGRIVGLIALPTRLDVVRREDMLALSFEFVNLRLDTDKTHIVRSDASKPAYLIVTFPPQSVAEKSFLENETGGPTPSDLPPVRSRVSGPTRLVFFVPPAVSYIHFSLKGEDGKGAKGLLDWERLTPSVVRTAFSSFGSRGPIRIDPSFKNPADLIKLPPGVLRRPITKIGEVKAAVGGLLAGRRGDQAGRRGDDGDVKIKPIQIRPLDDDLPKIDRKFNPAIVAMAIPHERVPVVNNPLYTAIELPVRLIMSPSEAQGWVHSAVAVHSEATGRFELWHTRLARRVDGNLVEGGKLPIRAVDAVDYETDIGEVIGNGPRDQAMARVDRQNLVNNMVYRSDREDSLPFYADRLMLTPLGGYLKGEGNWEWVYIPQRKKSELMSWTHNATLGRDHYVKIVTRGYLFPTGHPAARIKITERKISMTDNGPVAYLRQRIYVAIRQPTITYNEDEQRELGFKSITILTKQTPPLSDDTGPDKAPGAPNDVFWTLLSESAFPFSVQAEDVEGRTVRFGMPMIYVAVGKAQDKAFVETQLIPHYNSVTGSNALRPRRHSAFGQKVALAPAGDDSESTAYPVDELFFTALPAPVTNPEVDRAGYRCILRSAKVRVEAADYLAGQAAPPPIEVEIPAIYKTSGFGAQNVAKMFLKITDAEPPGGVPLKFGDASKSGGLVNPDSFITAFARGRGPVGGALENIQKGVVPTAGLLADSGKILGAVSLLDLLPDEISITPGDPNDPNTLKSPRMELKVEKNKDGKPVIARVEFLWRPMIGSWPKTDPIFKVNRQWAPNYAPLELSGTVTTDLVTPAKSSYDFVGVLRDFDLDCIAPASFIVLHFDELKFTSKSGEGSKVSITPEFPKTEFVGPLTFVQKFQDLLDQVSGNTELLASTNPRGLAKEGFEFTPFMNITAGAIHAGFRMGVPTLAFGAFAIANIALSAELVLPLIGESLSVRFAFCEKSSPFALSVMGFTGGGFLAIVLNPKGVELLEAALEFGGCYALNIGVASGSVSLMAGVYFKMQAGSCLLEGYVRLNGRVSVLGIVRVSVEFYLSLSYDTGSGCAYGTARVTVEIEVLFFSASVSMTVQKQFAGSKSANAALTAGDYGYREEEPTLFTQTMSENDWKNRYCAAFA